MLEICWEVVLGACIFVCMLSPMPSVSGKLCHRSEKFLAAVFCYSQTLGFPTCCGALIDVTAHIEVHLSIAPHRAPRNHLDLRVSYSFLLTIVMLLAIAIDIGRLT